MASWCSLHQYNADFVSNEDGARALVARLASFKQPTEIKEKKNPEN